MYKIKPEFINKIFKFNRNGIEITFDTSVQYTQYQLFNMYKLSTYTDYIEFTEPLLIKQEPIIKEEEIKEFDTTLLGDKLEYITLPKQEPEPEPKQEPTLEPESKPEIESKPKTKRKRKNKKCITCATEPCICDVPQVN